MVNRNQKDILAAISVVISIWTTFEKTARTLASGFN